MQTGCRGFMVSRKTQADGNVNRLTELVSWMWDFWWRNMWMATVQTKFVCYVIHISVRSPNVSSLKGVLRVKKTEFGKTWMLTERGWKINGKSYVSETLLLIRSIQVPEGYGNVSIDQLIGISDKFAWLTTLWTSLSPGSNLGCDYEYALPKSSNEIEIRVWFDRMTRGLCLWGQ